MKSHHPCSRFAADDCSRRSKPRARVQTWLPRHVSRGLRNLLAPLLFFSSCLCASAGFADWLEKVDNSLHVQTPNGFFRTDLSGLFDLEGYYIDQRPPGLIFGGNDDFVNPRLTLFLDTRLGKHFYSLVEARFDRGFDPRSEVRDARFDQYLLRYSPFDDSRLSLQAGKFATVIGNWSGRHDSWNNPFINAPVPYESVTTVSDHSAPASAHGFLARRDLAQKKDLWMPMVWGPNYASGAAVFGTWQKSDLALEVKNASLSSRPSSWDGRDLDWQNPTVSGRLGYRPGEAWNLGASASYGTYLLPQAATAPGFPAGKSIGDYTQLTIAEDLSYSWHHWQLWAELFFSRFDIPNVGNADSLAYYIEAKYKFSPMFFGALRWNQQFFEDVNNGTGGQTPWDRDLWRIDTALGCRLSRHLQAKLQYSYSHREGSLQQGEQLVAAQLTLKF